MARRTLKQLIVIDMLFYKPHFDVTPAVPVNPVHQYQSLMNGGQSGVPGSRQRCHGMAYS